MAEMGMGELEEKIDNISNVSIESKLTTNEEIINNDNDSESDDNLSLSVLETLASSDFINDRLLAVRFLVKYLKQYMFDEEQLSSVLAIMCKLSEDEDQCVKSKFFDIIPSVALLCKDEVETCCVMFKQFLGPYIMKLLTDDCPKVRKTGNSALVFSVESELIDDFQLTEWICPQIAELCTENFSDETRIEYTVMLCDIICLIRTDIAEKLLLKPFLLQCCSSFGVRTVCAQYFDKVCEKFGCELTEYKLLPTFLNLCNDEAWKIRLACTVVFKGVSSVVSKKTRTQVLTDFFLNLLNDTDNAVRRSAAFYLGEFICTFYDRPMTDNSDSESSSDTECRPENSNHLVDQSTDIYRTNDELKSNNILNPHDANENTFNNFQFWRNPFPDVDIDLETIEENKDPPWNSSVGEKEQLFRNIEHEVGLEFGIFDYVLPDEVIASSSLSEQNIVPFKLISSYILLTKEEPSCVRTFPAVVLTLGRKHWPSLKSLFLYLSFNVQPEVRSVIASSLHELVPILGSDIAVTDLIPVFARYLKDTEVRQKVVNHMYEFLGALENYSDRKFILPLFKDLALNGDERDWRYRHLVITQLRESWSFFNKLDMYKYILPVAFAHLEDKVSEVRFVSIDLISHILRCLPYDSVYSSYVDTLLNNLEVTLRKSSKWIRRQMYVLVCEQLYSTGFPSNKLLSKLVEPLFSLAEDKVPNVRIVLARCIHVILRGSFGAQLLEDVWKSERHKNLILFTLQLLKNDKDPDVTYFVRKYTKSIPDDIKQYL